MRVLRLIIAFKYQNKSASITQIRCCFVPAVLFFTGDHSMKQKYTILKDKASGNLMIQEYAELDKDLFSLVCEETYDSKEVASAASAGKMKLIAKLRTPNLYPIAEYADKIADAVMGVVKAKSDMNEPVELVFDDIKVIRKNDVVAANNGKPATAIIDDLLEDEPLDEIPEVEEIEDDTDLDMLDEEKDE
jgi:hypothetical protein